jgi:hypothetical protein
MPFPSKLLVMGALLSSIALAGGDKTKTWTGYVTDTHCGTHCQRTSNMKPDRKCIETCIRKGSKYGLWSGNQVYVLEPQAGAAKFAAENVRVDGEMINGIIRVTSIRPVSSPEVGH